MGSSISRRALLLCAGAATAGATAPILGQGKVPSAAADPSDDLGVPTAAPTPPTFYVSASGSDSADGSSPKTAWATIQRVSASLPIDRSIVLFRRGDTFYGELNLPFGCEVGAFGAGAKPIVTMFKLLNCAEGWHAHAVGVWKIDLGLPSTHSGYTATTDTNIGFLMVDGIVKPALKFELSELTAPWDFYCDIPNNTLYVAASANPTKLAANIKAAPNGNTYGATGRVIYCVKGSNKIRDVHVTGSGGCGIGGVAPDVQIHDCLIDYVGGSWLAGQSSRTTRYGNGIENWVSVKRWLIEGNEIAQVYDAAWSPQGWAGDGGSWEDMTFRNNHIHDCGQSFEFWSAGSSSGGFERILIEGNFCERAGYSVFSDVRPDQDVRVHLLTYLWETPADITIQDNVFDDAYGAYSYHAYEPIGLVSRNNIVRLKAGHRMQHQRLEEVERAAIWQAATGREAGSTITILS